jgi:hypothetical protein
MAERMGFTPVGQPARIAGVNALTGQTMPMRLILKVGVGESKEFLGQALPLPWRKTSGGLLRHFRKQLFGIFLELGECPRGPKLVS